jgi:phage terminase large subunit-like protein
LLDWHKRYFLRKIFFDPYQMQATAQRLTRAGLRIIEFPQTPANLTAASQNLFELIQEKILVVYPDDGMRLAMSHTVAIETPRGWRITKEKQSYKIDVIVALAMATYAAVQYHTEHDFNTNYDAWV